MEEKTKDLYGNEKMPITLSEREFLEYSKNVKSIYFNISIFAVSFLLLGIVILLLAALQELHILNVSDFVAYIIAFLIFVLFIFLWIYIFKKIIATSKKIYLDKIIIIDENLKTQIDKKRRWYSTKVILMIFTTLAACILGVILIVNTEKMYPGNSAYMIFSVILMFSMVIIPLFLTIYFYSDIYICDYLDKYYNF